MGISIPTRRRIFNEYGCRSWLETANTFPILHSWVSYGVSIGSILKNINRVVKGLHCNKTFVYELVLTLPIKETVTTDGYGNISIYEKIVYLIFCHSDKYFKISSISFNKLKM